MALSAYLHDVGAGLERNHSAKISEVQGRYAGLYRDSNTTETQVRSFYQKWMDARYNKDSISPRDAIAWIRLAERLTSSIVAKIALGVGTTSDAVEEMILERMIGGTSSLIEERISEANDRMLWQVEMEAEASEHMSRLGAKLFHSSNFCKLDASSGDRTTKGILHSNEHVSAAAVDFYVQFVKLVDSLQMIRIENGMKLDEAINFDLNLRLGYLGMSTTEIYREFIGAIPGGPERLTADQK